MNDGYSPIQASGAIVDGGRIRSRSSARFQATRWANVLAGLLYLALFSRIYASYISPVWGYTGLYYSNLSAWERVFQMASIGAVSFFLPRQLNKPSALIIWLLYAFIFVPTIAITFMIGGNPSRFYVSGLVALSAAMIICCLATQGNEPDGAELGPSKHFANLLLLSFALTAAVLYYTFREIMSFASIDDIYVQRFAAAEAGGGIADYLRTYFTYVFSPAMMAIALVSKRRWLIGAGIAGYILSYAIDAAKIALVIPAAILAFHLGLKVARIVSTSLYTAALALAAGIASLFVDYSGGVRFFVDVLLLRTITIPAQTFSQYYDLFEAKGYTYWSNTKIINLVVPPPAAFQSDPYWPVLGSIVGAEYYGNDSRMNANANLFVGEGIAAAGPIGVIVIACLLAIWLRQLDKYSSGWDRSFVVAAIMPVGMALTNIHLSTLLLSFGGFFWLIAFRFGRARPSRPA